MVQRRQTRYTTLGIEKPRPRYVVENRGKCKKKKNAVPSVSLYYALRFWTNTYPWVQYKATI